MIKHHTILQRIPSLNRPDSRPLGLVNIYDRIDTFAGQLLKHWVKAVRELCAVVRAQVAALGRSQGVGEVRLRCGILCFSSRSSLKLTILGLLVSVVRL